MCHKFSDRVAEEAIRLLEAFRPVDGGHLFHTATSRQVVPQSQIVPLLTVHLAKVQGLNTKRRDLLLSERFEFSDRS
jgi:hypothetical protein